MKNKYKILLVSEEEELLAGMKRLLEQGAAYEVEIINSGIDAFEQVQSIKYHLVIIDNDITDMDGVELLRAIKSYDALTQIIMMTGQPTMDKILSSLEYGANDLFMKPIKDFEEFVKIIDCSIEKLERWRDSIVQLVK